MEVKYRRASLEDLKIIQDIDINFAKGEFKNYDDTIIVDWATTSDGETYFKKHITDENSITVLAEYNGELVGLLIGTIIETAAYRTVGRQAKLLSIYVKEEYRKMKIGSGLMEKFTEFAKEKGMKSMEVTAYVRNETALNFYRNNGFEDYVITLEREL